MARIVHIALKVDDLEKTTQFYEKVFGFQPVETSKVRDHTSRHLSDGAIDLGEIPQQEIRARVSAGERVRVGRVTAVGGESTARKLVDHGARNLAIGISLKEELESNFTSAGTFGHAVE